MPTVPNQPPDDFYVLLASDLHAVADRIAELAGQGLPPCHLTVRYYPYGDDDDTNINAIDAFGQAVLGKTGAPQRMGDGSYHHHVEGHQGHVSVNAFKGIKTPEDKAKDDEITRLRAKLAELEAGQS